jgi:hypothetical protein
MDEDLDEKAKYTLCNEDQQKRINSLRYAFSEMYRQIRTLCKNSRECEIAMTRLEEAQMWAIKSISRED